MKKYSRVSYEDRCQISAMLKRDFSIKFIANELGFHKSTIYREIQRNFGFSKQGFYEGYFPREAQKKTQKRGVSRRRNLIIVGEIQEYVIGKLRNHWSPEQIAGRYKKETGRSLSYQSIYRFISKNKDLLGCLKFSRKRGVGRYRQKKDRESRVTSIRLRPKSANNRSRYGHWERDGMYGANRKQLLVCLERKSRFVKIAKMESIKADEVNELTLNLLNEEKVLSLTNDNGSEFRKKLKSSIPVYHCDPLRPDQRGSVENVIGVLRRKVKRNTDLEKMSERDIGALETWINLVPRKMFDFKTAYEVYYKKKVALVL